MQQTVARGNQAGQASFPSLQVYVGLADWAGGAQIGQIDVNREQKPRSADLSGDIVAGSPIPGEGEAKPETGPETGNDGGVEGGMDEAPPWAAPLRDMYQQVVEEPLPDFLSDLLSRLDRDAE